LALRLPGTFRLNTSLRSALRPMGFTIQLTAVHSLGKDSLTSVPHASKRTCRTQQCSVVTHWHRRSSQARTRSPVVTLIDRSSLCCEPKAQRNDATRKATFVRVLSQHSTPVDTRHAVPTCPVGLSHSPAEGDLYVPAEGSVRSQPAAPRDMLPRSDVESARNCRSSQAPTTGVRGRRAPVRAYRRRFFSPCERR
jgi:hypothetical protein